MAILYQSISVFNLIGGFQAFLIAVILLMSRPENRRARKILGLFVLACSLATLSITVSHMGEFLWISALENFEYALATICGPLLLAYFMAMIDPHWRWRKIHLLHALPALLLLFAIPLALYSQPFPWEVDIRFILMHQLAYTTVIAILMSKTFGPRLFRWRSANRRQKELQIVLALMINIHLAQFIRLFGLYPEGFVDIVPFVITVTVMAIGFVAVSKSLLFSDPTGGEVRHRYAASTLTPQVARQYSERLVELMEQQKPFLQQGLTLKELARYLGIPSNHLSQVINEQQQQTYSDFVNQYRINEAIRLLQDPARAHYKIESIAQSTGFKSRSAFYHVFKKLTGISPGEFQKRHCPTR